MIKEMKDWREDSPPCNKGLQFNKTHKIAIVFGNLFVFFLMLMFLFLFWIVTNLSFPENYIKSQFEANPLPEILFYVLGYFVLCVFASRVVVKKATTISVITVFLFLLGVFIPKTLGNYGYRIIFYLYSSGILKICNEDSRCISLSEMEEIQDGKCHHYNDRSPYYCVARMTSRGECDSVLMFRSSSNPVDGPSLLSLVERQINAIRDGENQKELVLSTNDKRFLMYKSCSPL